MDLSHSRTRTLCVVLLASLIISAAADAEASTTLDSGYEALSKSDYETALARFDEVIRAEPDNAAAHHGRGLALGLKGDLDLAITELSKAIELDPKETTAYGTRGAFYLGKHEYSRAIADCDEAIRRDAEDRTAFNNRGFSYLMSGNTERAICDFNEAIRLGAKTSRVYANRGLAWCKQREYDRALPDLDEAIRLTPTNAAALLLRGGVYSHKGKLPLALADLNEAIRLAPELSDAYHQRACVYYFRGETDRAVADFTEVIRRDPNNADAHAGRGACLASRQDFDGAIAELTQAVTLRPEWPFYHEARGSLWIQRGDFERGIEEIATAIRLNPADPAATFQASLRRPLASAELQHGEQQVRQMLRDRPTMESHGEKAQLFYRWAARKFAGEDLGQLVFWDPTEPPPGCPSAWYAPTATTPAIIQVRRRHSGGAEDGKDRSFEDLWHDVIFELYNVANAEHFGRIDTAADAGTLSKDAYIDKTIACESRAAENTRAFYICLFLPWAKEHDVSTYPLVWLVGWRADPKDNLLLGRIAKQDLYLRFYARRYDHIVLGSLVRKREYRKALALAEALYPQAETPGERSLIQGYKTRCLLELQGIAPTANPPDQTLHSPPSGMAP